MAERIAFLAFDMGAESGRAIVGAFDGSKVELEEVHRFANEPVMIGNTLHWDILRLFHETKKGLAAAIQRRGESIVSLGVDTWGVDFGFLDKHGNLLSNPVHYRDKRTDGILEKAFKVMPRAEVFGNTGIQIMQINTLYQLFAMRLAGSVLFDVADTLLFIPGLLMYFYTGVRNCDSTIASTSQIYDLRSRSWSGPVVQAFGIPAHVLPQVTDAGAIVGELAPLVRRELGAPALKVVTPGGHDTACAVASVPAVGSDYIYLSCGTWSLMGIEEGSPIINEVTEEFSFTNEGGVCNTVRLLKNIAGLWPVQECRRAWEREGARLDYGEITAEASAAAPFFAFIDPDDPAFLNPPHMPTAIQDFCRRTGQKVPQSRGEIVRAALEGLALKYRFVADRLERVAGRRLDTIHMVGGGINNKLLCRMAAGASGRRVIAGPAEATAIGNVLMQAMALGEIGTLGELREVVRNSFATEVYEPSDTEAWDAAYERFTGILNQSSR